MGFEVLLHQMAANPHPRFFHFGGSLYSTSKVEGAPYSILEAMSCRCPVLTSDSDGVSSAVIHNQTGKILLFRKY
ncbi:glycosyltransferase [Paenibacillus alginolyticus]|uniref:glycosyltransferase n=1 Tax=Paenibacillus alginolyticus TaxID=59839 RepID=UPI0035E42972